MEHLLIICQIIISLNHYKPQRNVLDPCLKIHFIQKDFIRILCVCFACIYVYVPRSQKKALYALELELRYRYESPCGYQEPNPGLP